MEILRVFSKTFIVLCSSLNNTANVLTSHSSFCKAGHPSRLWLYKQGLTLYHTIPHFNDPKQKTFEIIVGKGENAGNQHFVLFPQCFIVKKKKSKKDRNHHVSNI